MKANLLLHFFAAQPVEVLVHGFWPSGLDLVVDCPKRSDIVSLHGGWGMFVVHFLMGCPCWDTFLGIEEQCPQLAFCG